MSNYPYYFPLEWTPYLSYDPTFIMPMALMLLNYYLLNVIPTSPTLSYSVYRAQNTLF